MGYYLNSVSNRSQFPQMRTRQRNVFRWNTRRPWHDQNKNKRGWFSKLLRAMVCQSAAADKHDAAQADALQRDNSDSVPVVNFALDTLPSATLRRQSGSTAVDTPPTIARTSSHRMSTCQPIPSPTLNSTSDSSLTASASMTTMTLDVAAQLKTQQLVWRVLHTKDLLTHILSYVDWRDLVLRCTLVNKQWHTYCISDNAFQHCNRLNFSYEYNVQLSALGVQKLDGSMPAEDLQSQSVQSASHSSAKAKPQPSRASQLLQLYVEKCGSAQHIQHLDLSYTDISDVDLQAILPYKNLRTLNLYGSHAGDKIAQYIYRLYRLRELNASHTKITFKSISYICSLKGLQSLTLSAQSLLNSPCTSQLARLTNLKQLHLEAMAVNDIDLTQLATLTKLEVLECIGLQAQRLPLKGTCFTAELGHAFSKLHTLRLVQSELTNTGLINISQHLRALRTLDISNCFRLTDGCMQAFVESTVVSTQLESLSIAYCSGLTEAGLDYVPFARNLHTLSLRGCCISNASVVDLMYGCNAMRLPLRDLDIGGFHQLIPPDQRVDDSSLDAFVSDGLLPELEVLRLVGCRRISGDGILDTLPYHPGLKKIVVDQGKLVRHNMIELYRCRREMQRAPLEVVAVPV